MCPSMNMSDVIMLMGMRSVFITGCERGCAMDHPFRRDSRVGRARTLPPAGRPGRPVRIGGLGRCVKRHGAGRGCPPGGRSCRKESHVVAPEIAKGSVLVLTEREVAELLDLDRLVDALAAAMRDASAG